MGQASSSFFLSFFISADSRIYLFCVVKPDLFWFFSFLYALPKALKLDFNPRFRMVFFYFRFVSVFSHNSWNRTFEVSKNFIFFWVKLCFFLFPAFYSLSFTSRPVQTIDRVQVWRPCTPFRMTFVYKLSVYVCMFLSYKLGVNVGGRLVKYRWNGFVESVLALVF